MPHGRPLVLPSGAGQSQGSALVTPAGVLLPCPDQTQVGEAIMTKEAEALCIITNDQRGLPRASVSHGTEHRQVCHGFWPDGADGHVYWLLETSVQKKKD